MKHKIIIVLLQAIGFWYWLKIITNSNFLQEPIKFDNVCMLLIGSIFYILLFILSIIYYIKSNKLKHLFLIMNIIFLSTLVYGKLKEKLLLTEEFYGIYKPTEKLTLCKNIYFNVLGFKIYDSIENSYLTISQYQTLYEKYYKKVVINSKNPIKIKLSSDLKPFITSMLWKQTFQKKHKWAVSLSYLKNNTIIVAGNSYSKKYNAWLLKIDQRGNKIWEKIFQNKYVNSILPLKNGHFIVIGYIKYAKNTSKYIPWIAKIDNEGHIVWSKTYTQININEISSAISTNDGGVVIVASLISLQKKITNTYSFKYTPYIFKIDNYGYIKWEKKYKNKNAKINTLISIKDNKFITGGFIYQKDDKFFKAWIATIDKNGNLINEKVFENKYNSYINSMDNMKNSNIIMAGAIGHKNRKLNSAWVAIIDSYGNIITEKVFDVKYNSEFYNLAPVEDNKFILAAFTWSKCDNIRKRWLIMLSYAQE